MRPMCPMFLKALMKLFPFVDLTTVNLLRKLMIKILFMPMFLTRILPFHGGQAQPKPGGNFVLHMIGGWEDLFGQALIIAESPLPINGLISIHILGSWICAAFPKIFITIISHGGQIKMYYISHLIGTGMAKKDCRSMYG